jgi:putative hydrolase of the HAD superfamily
MIFDRALVLDFGGVISRTMFETHDLTEKAIGLLAGSLTWTGPFPPHDDALWQDMQSGKISERDYWMTRTRETGARIGKNWSKMEDFVRAARGADPDAIIRPEFRTTLTKVRAAGLKLAILSNELDLFYGADFRSKLPFLKYFDVIVDATYTNILKPDPCAYLSVCDQLSLPPQHCVFVDDQSKNIRGADDVGMPTVHFDVMNPQKSYDEALFKLGLSQSQEQEI